MRSEYDVVEALRWDKRYTSGHVAVTMENAAKEIIQLRRKLKREERTYVRVGDSFVAEYNTPGLEFTTF